MRWSWAALDLSGHKLWCRPGHEMAIAPIRGLATLPIVREMHLDHDQATALTAAGACLHAHRPLRRKRAVPFRSLRFRQVSSWLRTRQDHRWQWFRNLNGVRVAASGDMRA